MLPPSRFPRTISNFRCCTECALTSSAGSSRMATAFASTFLTARTGSPTSCAVSPSVPPTSPSWRVISSATKVHSPSSRIRWRALQLSILRWPRYELSVCCSAMRDHANAMLGTQRNRREEFDGKLRHDLEMIFLLNHRQQQRGFHHREGRTHANARTSTKREIRETRNFAGTNRIFLPSFGVESLRIGEKARVALRAPLQNEDI